MDDELAKSPFPVGRLANALQEPLTEGFVESFTTDESYGDLVSSLVNQPVGETDQAADPLNIDQFIDL